MERYTLNKNAEGYTDLTAPEGIKRDRIKDKTNKPKTTEAQEQKSLIEVGKMARKEISRVKNAYACSE